MAICDKFRPSPHQKHPKVPIFLAITFTIVLALAGIGTSLYLIGPGHPLDPQRYSTEKYLYDKIHAEETAEIASLKTEILSLNLLPLEPDTSQDAVIEPSPDSLASSATLMTILISLAFTILIPIFLAFVALIVVYDDSIIDFSIDKPIYYVGAFLIPLFITASIIAVCTAGAVTNPDTPVYQTALTNVKATHQQTFQALDYEQEVLRAYLTAVQNGKDIDQTTWYLILNPYFQNSADQNNKDTNETDWLPVTISSFYIPPPKV